MTRIHHGWKTLIFLIVYASVNFTGCGGGNDEDASATATTDSTIITGYSCSITGMGATSCQDFTGSDFSTGTAAKERCDAMKSEVTTITYATSACPTTVRFGSCKLKPGQADEFIIRFLTGYDSTSARVTCEGFGGDVIYTPN